MGGRPARAHGDTAPRRGDSGSRGSGRRAFDHCPMTRATSIQEGKVMNQSYPGCRAVLAILVTLGLVACVGSEGRAAELLVGGATVSITPDQPVALEGQMVTRIARK